MKVLIGASLLAATAVLALPAAAQTAPQTWIHAGKLIDRPGKPPRGPSTIVVENGRIVAVRDGIVAPDRADATLIDLSGQTVLPGLIDSHVHLTSDAGGIEGQLEEVTLSPAAQAFNAQANGLKTLRAGLHHGPQPRRWRRGDAGAARCDRGGQGAGAADRRCRHVDLGHRRAHGRQPGLSRRTAADVRRRGQHLQRRGRLPPRGAAADCARGGRHQVRLDRRGQQPDRRGAGPPDVRRRGQGDRRDGAHVRQEGRGPRPWRGRDQAGAGGGRGFDRARHDARRRRDRRLGQGQERLLRADAVDGERLQGTARGQPQRLCARRARQDPVPHLDHRQGAAGAGPARASRSRSGPMPACPSTAATPTSSS